MATVKPKLHVIVGSTRPSRAGKPVAEWFARCAQHQGDFDAVLVDLASFRLPLLDEVEHPRLTRYAHEHTRAWSASVSSADAFVFVTPEYDFFAPAAVVNAIQCLWQEWQYKAAGVVSYGGISGGLRAAQPLKQLLTNVGVMPMVQSVAIPNFGQHIQDAQFDPTEIESKAANVMLTELHRWTSALASLRA